MPSLPHRLLLVFALLGAFAKADAANAHAKPSSSAQASSAEPAAEPPPNDPRTHEFQNDEIGLVLRTLAHQAGISLVVADEVKGAVTMRLVNKTPKEAFQIVVATSDLVAREKNGVYVVTLKHPPPPSAQLTPVVTVTPSESSTKQNDDFGKAIADVFGSGLMGMMGTYYDGLLDYMAKPETAKRLAKAKRAYYEALMAEGFSKDEAFRMILSEQTLDLPDHKDGK